MRGRLWCGLLCLLLLVGCKTVAETRAEQEDDAKCQSSYGVKPGEPAYVQCRAMFNAARTAAPDDPRNPGLLTPGH